MYSKPVYSEGVYYFLQVDYGEKKVTLYKYLPEEVGSLYWDGDGRYWMA